MNYSQINGIHSGLPGLPEFAELSKSDGSTTSEMQQAPNSYATTAFSNNQGKQQFMSPHLQLQQQSAAMAEYLQKLHATSLPLTLQQIMKLQSEPHPTKREKPDDENDEKNEQSQANSILNIPSVPAFRNGQNPQNGNNNTYMNHESMMMEINPHDLNVHMEDSSSPEVGGNNGQSSEVQVRIDGGGTKMSEQQASGGESTSTKNGDNRTRKFRAKTGEIKIAMGLDGSMLYCCPECSLAFSDKVDIENHIQGHVQERKYQCKECGAMLKRKEHLDQHMRGHSNKRPYKCPVCQKAFKRNEHLTRHYVIHSGDKNFTCTICAKAFSRKDHLNKHAQTHLGMKRTKTGKKESSSTTTMDNNDVKDHNDGLITGNDEASTNSKNEGVSFLQHIHHLQKDQNFIQTFSAFKEQAIRDGSVVSGVGGGNGSGAIIQQQQAVNMSEILPQSSRYLMPSQLQS